MPNDIREIINSLDEQDKTMFNQHRTEMRRSYLTAHNSVLGLNAWCDTDDMFLDLIDIKLALLFDKSGRLQTTKTIEDGKEIEESILAKSDATKLMMHNGWPVKQ